MKVSSPIHVRVSGRMGCNLNASGLGCVQRPSNARCDAVPDLLRIVLRPSVRQHPEPQYCVISLSRLCSQELKRLSGCAAACTPCTRVVLWELLLMAGDNSTPCIVDDEASGLRPLIDGSNAIDGHVGAAG
jgi:hypothetical protein